VAAVAVGAAAIGAMAGYASGQSNTSQTTTAAPSTTVVYTTLRLPPRRLALHPNTTVVQGVTYYQCGTSWYTQAYGSNGVIYTPVPSPQ